MVSIFKQMLRSEMEYHDIKIKELSAKTGISARTLEGYLSSRGSIPPADVAVKIAKVFNVSVEFLITGKNNDSNDENDFNELIIFHKYYQDFKRLNELPESIQNSILLMIKNFYEYKKNIN